MMVKNEESKRQKEDAEGNLNAQQALQAITSFSAVTFSGQSQRPLLVLHHGIHSCRSAQTTVMSCQFTIMELLPGSLVRVQSTEGQLYGGRDVSRE